MKKFVDGEILTASDLNANFAEAGSVQRGTLVGTTLAADATYSVDITFPVPFDTVPTVITGSNEGRVSTSSKDPTKTGFRLSSRNVSAASAATPTTYWWIAVAS